MTINLQIAGTPHAGHRLTIEPQAANGRASIGSIGSDITIELRRPTLGERFGRALKNIVTFGAHTKSLNRAQWAEFRAQAMNGMSSLEDGTNRHDDELMNARSKWWTTEAVDRAFSAYDGKRLTRSRAANVLAELERIATAPTPPADRSPRMLRASTGPLPRLWRSIKQLCRHLTVRERELRRNAQTMLEQSQHGGRRAEAARQIISVLRPGRAMASDAIYTGQQALRTYAEARSVAFGTLPSTDIDRSSMVITLNHALQSDAWRQFSEASQSQRNSGVFTIPLGLTGGGAGHEDHSVLLALDVKSQKVLYLDAKGNSIAHAARHYASAGGDLEAAVTALGKRAFGDHWNPSTGVLNMTIPKQQGANDCGAFTHAFTRRLIEGQSVGDIERSFSREDRRDMRAQMAQDLTDHANALPHEVDLRDSQINLRRVTGDYEVL